MNDTSIQPFFLVVLLLLSLQTSVSAVESKVSDASDLVVEAKVGMEGLKKMMAEGRLGLPQLRVYDGAGRLLREFGTGFSPATFEKDLEALTAQPVAPAETPVALAAELAGLLDAAGEPLELPADRDLVFVEYWADWCVPCHAQFEALVEFPARTPNLETALIHADLVLPTVPVQPKPGA